MKENKNVQYTYGPGEKEILQKMSTVEASVSQNNQEKNQRELVSTKYYSEFVIKTKQGPATLNNVFITAERNKEGEMSYHFRWIIQKENGEQTIEENLVIDENGEVYTSQGLKDYLGDADIDIEDLMSENDSKKGRLKGISEKAEPEEMEQALEEEQKNQQKRKKQGEDQEQEVPEEELDEETEQIEEDLEEQGQDLKISKYKKIKDSSISERMPEVFQDGVENGIAFSNKLNRFVIISKVNGHYQINENVEPARMTWRTITSISPDGQQVERKVPHALMELPNNDEKEIAVTLDQYGDVDIETVDVLPCQERIARPVREEGEGIEGQENAEITREFATEGKYYGDEIAHKKEELETEYKVTETNMEELKELDIEAIMEVEAQKAKMSKEGFKEYVKKADGKTLQEKIENAHEQIEQEYKGGQRPR